MSSTETTGTLVGLLVDGAGQPLARHFVLLTPLYPDVVTPRPALMTADPIHLQTDADGRLNDQVVATDTMEGVEWWWRAEIPGSDNPARLLQIPTGATVDLADGLPIIGETASLVIVARPGVGIKGIVGEGDIMTVTLTDGTTTDVALPVADPLPIPALSTDGTRLLVDGTPTGAPIRGDDGHTPVVTWEGTALVVDEQPPVDLQGPPPPVPDVIPVTVTTLAAGAAASATVSGTWPDIRMALGVPQGVQGAPGDLTEIPAPPPTRGPIITTAGTLALVRIGRTRVLTVSGLSVATTGLLCTLPPEDAAATPTPGWIGTVDDWLPVLVVGTEVRVTGTPPTTLAAVGGSLVWRT
ncbi:MAG: hypothetical protein Q4G35_03195 [Propionibacteriaceae bacterium]|nr:hypothetical protein [Propionibacteriaceae bacterium]